ncbi:hypothetical protein PORY_001498, partial [Pneumocystis oryctolagi]
MLKKKIQKLGQMTIDPPDELSVGQEIACVMEVKDHDLYLCKIANGETLLAELPSRFRCKIWVKRGGFVVLDTQAFNKKECKIRAEIFMVIQNEKAWRKKKYWPDAFKEPEDISTITTQAEISTDDDLMENPNQRRVYEKELRSLYRQFWRIGHQAVHHAIPAKYAIRDKIREAFRAPLPSMQKIHNTLEFLTRASKKKSPEHAILKNLCRLHQLKKLYIK